VGPGAVLFVDKNGWTKTEDTLTRMALIVGFATSLFVLADHIYDIYSKLR
jgi:hypothetical protein